MSTLQSSVPSGRIHEIESRVSKSEVNADGDYVVYWMIASRRTEWNFGLQRAVEWAKELKKPLVIFEALRSTYQWNSDRIHAFVIQGMADNARKLSRRSVTYYPYVEPKAGDERGLLKELTAKACVVVSDDFPCFFLPRMVKAAARQIPVKFELVDSNGLYPMRDTDRVFSRAYDFRRHLQKTLLPHLAEVPKQDPLKGARLQKLESLPKKLLKRWPAADPIELSKDLPTELSKFAIDHDVTVSDTIGGVDAGRKRIDSFLNSKLDNYSESRNQPEKMMTSGLSPYLHFGHVSAFEIFDRVVKAANWSPDLVAEKAKGSSSGWWGTSEAVESFLDELITWRELGYNMCVNLDNYTEYESLPEWAQKTLREHAKDKREYLYSDDEFEFGKTHDRLWNAAQWQLVTTGIIHNYLRMLWGKKILEWSKTPQDALATMIHLNNKYALDGRNPNSYSGIFWVLGRYDRAWGERPVFGKIRFMSSDNTARKVKVKNYIEMYHPPSPQKQLFS